MKKRNVILQAAIAAAFIAPVGFAQAGAITAGNVNYAVEAITSATTVTLGDIVYTMGVARTTAQDFVVIYTLPAGVTFAATPAVPVVAGGTAAATVTLKRGGVGTNEVVYDVDVTTAFVGGTATLTLTAPTITNSGLTTAGATVAVTMALKDTGETSFVDNVGTLSSTRATAANASNFYDSVASAAGVATDTSTTIDVGYSTPLAGFRASGDDVALRAEATVQVANTTTGVKNAANAADYTLVAGDLVTVTVTDPTNFLGLSTGGFCYDLDDSDACAAAETFTVSGNTATLANLAGNNGAFSADHSMLYIPTGTTAMGTARTLSIAGNVAPTAGTAHAFTGNSSWWQWASNGTVLQTPWFSNASGWISRFVLTNTGTTAATYSSTCLAETGNTPTAGASATGTVPAGGQLVMSASDVCTFSGATRGAMVFTVNGPSANIQGTYTLVNASTGSSAISNMMRPGSN